MEQPDRILHKVYQAAGDAELWPNVCDDISEIVGGGSVHLLLASLETGDKYVNLFARGDPRMADEYLHDYASMDFRAPRVMSRALGTFVDEREYVSEEEARASVIHQELLPRYDIHKISGSNMSLDGCIGWFGISTKSASDEFEGRHRDFLKWLSPHLLNAFKIAKTRHELNLSRALSLASLDLMNSGLFMFEKGALVHTNEAAKYLLSTGFLTVRSGRLACANVLENERLAAFMRDPARPSHGSLLIRDYERGAAYLVRIHNLFPRFENGRMHPSGHQAVSVVELNIPANPRFDEVAAFCAGYGISNSETRAIHAVLNSVNLASYAKERNISLYTIQQQLKSAMAKMGLNSQKKIFQAFERYRTLA